MLVAAAAREDTTARPTVVRPAKGDLLGRYMILEELGRGGLGEVYTAYDPDLDRKVALKVLKAGTEQWADVDELRARLLREAQSLAKVSHPNVVAVHDVGVADGQVFIAMEIAEGLTLREWLDASKRAPRDILRVFMAAAEGLAAAHRSGLVHRDFKPANVLVGEQRVRVLDFGLARVMTATVPALGPQPAAVDSRQIDQTITRSGMILGTPAYMAPEQYRTGNQDARGDQFSFCVALYEALHGTRPFKGKTLSGIVEAAERRELPSTGRKAPPHIHRALVRGLSPEPGERFASMEALIAACTRTDRRRWGWAAALAASVVLGTGAWLNARPTEPPASVDTVARIVSQARLAASRSHFVYPPPADPATPTAFQKVVELDAVDPAEANSLRREFSTTLVGLGDRYWDRDHGRPFAVDYYAAALVFAPEHAHALARAMMSDAALQRLRRRAAMGEFSPADLVAAAPLAVLAADDPQPALRQLLASENPPSAITTEHLVALLGPPQVVDSAPLASAPAPPQLPPAGDDVEPTTPPAAGPARSRPKPSPRASEREELPPTRAPSRAKELVEDGKAAVRALQLATAEKLFHRALKHNPSEVSALIELRDLQFQRGRYREAIRYGSSVVKARPKAPDHKIRLGDLYFRVREYDAAQSQYERAQQLGDARAGRRLERLKDKLGE